MIHELVIQWEYHEEIPDPHERYCAWIEGDKYKGMVVTGDSVSECVKEIAASLWVMEQYKKENHGITNGVKKD